jgi:hypothetical protein
MLADSYRDQGRRSAVNDDERITLFLNLGGQIRRVERTGRNAYTAEVWLHGDAESTSETWETAVNTAIEKVSVAYYRQHSPTAIPIA